MKLSENRKQRINKYTIYGQIMTKFGKRRNQENREDKRKEKRKFREYVLWEQEKRQKERLQAS